MNRLLPIFALAAAAAATQSTLAQTPAATTAAARYSTGTTTIGDLVANPATKAVLDKHLPGLSTDPQIQMASGMTLRSVQQFAPDKLTDKVLDETDTDLARIK